MFQHWAFTPFAIPVFLSSAVCLGVLFWSSDGRHTPTRFWFNLLMVGMIIWAFFYGLELLNTSLQGKIILVLLSSVGSHIVPVSVFFLHMAMTGRSEWIKPEILLIVSVVPTIIVFLMFTNAWHGLFWADTWLMDEGILTRRAFVRGPAYWIDIGYAYMILGFSYLILVIGLFSKATIYRRQAAIGLLSAIAPIIPSILYNFDVIPTGWQIAPATFWITALIIVYGMKHYGSMDIVPLTPRFITNSMADPMIVLDHQNRIVETNHAMETALDVSLIDQMGSAFDQALVKWPALVEAIRHYEDGAEEMITVSLAEGRVYNLRKAPVHDLNQLDDSFVLVLRDVTRLVEIEAMNRQLSQAVAQSANMVTITDKDGLIEFVNPAMVKTTEYDENELLGATPSLFASNKTKHKQYDDLWDTITQGDIWKGEFLNKSKSGNLYWVSETISPLFDEQRKLTHYLSISEDITERKETEEALALLIADLEAYAHTVAHDLKSPLALIVGYTDVIEYGTADLDDETIAYLQRIKQIGMKMSGIVDELLLMASINRRTEIDLHPLNMAAIMTEVMSRFVEDIKQAEATVTLPDDWPTAIGYGPWIEEVWANYLSNALKYGGKSPQIVLGGSQTDNGMARFWVRDQGPGLTAEQQDRLFEQFKRVDGNRRLGHGLGLSIVERIITRLDGDVAVESTPDEGACFSFTLPVP